mmetsp:Transcript_9360/g.22735  ORF Transcript_9360/g.22735 Transcript_9360/m.22735 type:complete len:203 (+) Transcript_9360:3883-4491(+)
MSRASVVCGRRKKKRIPPFPPHQHVLQHFVAFLDHISQSLEGRVVLEGSTSGGINGNLVDQCQQKVNVPHEIPENGSALKFLVAHDRNRFGFSRCLVGDLLFLLGLGRGLSHGHKGVLQPHCKLVKELEIRGSLARELGGGTGCLLVVVTVRSARGDRDDGGPAAASHRRGGILRGIVRVGSASVSPSPRVLSSLGTPGSRQ